jgi:propionyl-CoA carboxylase alpha chain
VTFDRIRVVRLGEQEHRVEVRDVGEVVTAAFLDAADGLPPHEIVSNWKPGDVVWHGTVDGEAIVAQVRGILNGFALSHRGVTVAARVYTETEAAAARLMPQKKASDLGKRVLCPMPGLVVSIAVTEGQDVKAGETVAVVEAMKMENVLRAERDGKVKKVHAKPGETLAVDAVILEFE